MGGESTIKDALLAEVLGDLDGIIKRVEALPELLKESDSSLKETVSALEKAGDKYREAVSTQTSEFQTQLNDYAAKQKELARESLEQDAVKHKKDLQQVVRDTLKEEFKTSTLERLWLPLSTFALGILVMGGVGYVTIFS